MALIDMAVNIVWKKRKNFINSITSLIKYVDFFINYY